MKKHTTIFTCSLIFLLFCCVPLYGHTQPHPDTLLANQYNQKIENVAPLSEVFIKDLQPGHTYSILFVVNDELSCVPILSMNQNFKTYRETSTQIILEFRASQAVQSIQLKSPCPEIKGNFFIETHCESCPYLEHIGNTERSQAVISAVSGTSPEELVLENFVAGGCYEVDNITFKGPDIARGLFSQGEASISMDEGIILATGDVRDCKGPNQSSKTSTKFENSAEGDTDLSMLLRIIGSQIRTVTDVAILEFDFTPTQDEVSFEYVFASDEYCDFVGSGFNDVFGFFISGPGINGPFSNNGENIAQLPNSDTYVSINTINWGENRPFYNNNRPLFQLQQSNGCTLGEAFGTAVAKNELEYDGFTDILTASATVIPCETYHIKLAIGDVADDGYDSAVFFKKNSFSLGDPAELSTEIPDASFPDSNLVYESCQESFFVFKRTEDSDRTRPQIVPFNISSTSTATVNIDYSAIPSPVIIPIGQDSIRVPVTVFEDGVPEGPESIIFELESACTCEGLLTELIIIEPEEPSVNFEELSTCIGGEISLSPQIEGGVGDFTYEWSTNETTPTISAQIDEPTTYAVTVTDQCGTTSMAEIQVTIEEQVAVLSGDVLICNGEAMNQITVNFTGSGPYSLEYEFNGEQRNISNIEESNYQLPETAPGIYQAISMTSNGCMGTGEGTAQIEVSEVNIEYRASSPKCHDSTDGFIELRMDENEGTYTYEWNNGAADARLDNLLEGDFEVTVTNELGCESTESFSLNIPEELTASITPNGLVNCYNPTAGSIDLEVEGGTPGYAYAWSNGAGILQNPTNLEGGMYTVVITDLNGCETILETEIIADLEEPLAAIQVDKIISCRNDEVVLTALGTSTGFLFNYQWSSDDGQIDRYNSPLEPVVSREGTYSLEVINTSNGCINTVTASVKADTEQPSIELEEVQELNCQIETQNLIGIILDGLVDYSLDWTTNDGNFISDTDILEPEIDAAGTYSLMVTNNENGCIVEESIVVSANKISPSFQIVEPNILSCDRNAVSINADLEGAEEDYSIVWETTAGNFLENRNTLNPVVDQPGVYTIKITDTENFCESEEQVTILLDTLSPNIEAGDPAIFTCDITQMNLNATIRDNRIYNYQWTTEDGNILSGDDSLIPTIDAPGTYSVIVKDEINGCEAADRVVITDDINRPNVLIESPPFITCVDESVQLDASNSTQGGNLNYRWETFDGDIVDATNPINPIMGSAGTYLLFVVDQSNGCEGRGIVEVGIDTIAPTAMIEAADVFNCKSESVEIDGTASSTGSNFQFNWRTTDGTIISNTNVVSPAVGAAGTYFLEILNTANGCITETSLVIIDEKPTELDVALNQPLCHGDKGQANVMQVVGGVGPYTYSIDGGNRFNNEAGFSLLSPGFYNVVVKDVNDCELEEVIEIVEPDEVVVDLGLQQEIGLGDSTNLAAITNIPEGQVAEIMWFPSNGLSCDDCLNPSAKPFQSVNYEVTIIDQNGCEANSDVRLLVDQTPQIYVPNILSTSASQAENGRFTIFAKQGMVNQIITLEVYDRWGETVFQRKNFAPNDPNFGWDGSFNRKKMRPAVFAYRAKLEMIDGRMVELSGDITLMD